MKRNILLYCLLCAILILGVESCSTTANLPEDEVLYTGITEINFGQKPKKKKEPKEKEGVIAAINDAYESVERVLSGGALYNEKTLDMDDLTDFERDSIEASQQAELEAMGTVKDEVTAVLSIAPNNSLMGSAKYRFPLPIGLWVYNRYVDSKHKFGKWMFNSFSATPVTLTSVNPQLRTRIAQNVLHNYGYFRGDVTYDIYEHKKNPRKAKVGYTVNARQLYRLDSIAYLGFPELADSMMRSKQGETLLHRGDPFTAASLDAERTRLYTMFRNNGYYYAQPNYFAYRADTIQRPSWVQLQVVPSREVDERAGHKYYLRNTRIHLVDPLRGTEETDSLGRRGNIRMFFAGAGSKHKPSVRFGALRRNIFYKKGEPYRQFMSSLTQEKLTELGIFSQVSLDYVPADTTSTCDSLDIDILAVLDKRYDFELTANASKKNNGLVGPGLSFSMTRRNAFHGAEALTFEVHGSYEWQTGQGYYEDASASVRNSYSYGTSLTLDYPYIKLGKIGRPFLRRGISSTSFKISADWMNRADYFGRVSVGTRVTLNYQRKPVEEDIRTRRHKPVIKHEFTPFRLDYDFKYHTTDLFDFMMICYESLNVSMRDQFVPSMQYVLSMNSRPASTHPSTFTLTLKEAGNVTSGIYACFGQKFSKRDKELFGVPFAQYFKGVAEFAKTYNIGSGGVKMAGRVLLGAVYSYGNSTIAPYNDLFAIGGANSVRGFAARSIGPGSYRPEDGKYNYVDQVGDLKFEANLECRFPIVGNLEGAAFLDCGNVWLMTNNEDHPGGDFKFKNLGKELALGTGVGLRYDLDFLVIRFDLGIGLHAPYDTGKSGYYNMPKFGKSLGYHLAVGYPF